MSTPSSTPAEPKRRRDLRDSTIGRIAILLVVLAVAGIAARSCAGAEERITKDEAIEIAESVALFEPDGVEVRFLRQGVQSRPTWLVSFYRGPVRNPTIAQTILVDADTGQITDDGV